MFINQKPWTFAPGVLWIKNPVFEAFMDKLKLFSFEVRPSTFEEYSSGYSGKNVMKAGIWTADQIMLGQPDDVPIHLEPSEEPIPLESQYVTVWCGMATFEQCIPESSEDWLKIQEIWRLL